jgi:hypothetical protein
MKNEEKNLINNHKVHMISYGNEKFINSKKRIFNEAINSKFFYSIQIYEPEDLNKEFKYKFKDILKQNRGGGYWLWKLDIIKQKLSTIDDNDYLIYLDSGCTINKNGLNRLIQYINLLEESIYGIISFKLTHQERIWTIKEIFEYFNIKIDSKEALDGQYIGTILIMKKNKHLKNLINKWEEVINKNNLLITDNFNKNQGSFFKDNRHDQSLLSILRKIHGSIILNDETYFGKYNKENYENNENSLKYPFWATRIKN